MSNLLIGYVTGDFLQKLIDESDKWVFQSKVLLIFQYCYMLRGRPKKYHNTNVRDFKLWHSNFRQIWQDDDDDETSCELCMICCFLLFCWPLFLVCLWCGKTYWDEDLFQSDMTRLKTKHVNMSCTARINTANDTVSAKYEVGKKIDKIESMIDEMRKGHATMLLADCKKVRGGRKSTAPAKYESEKKIDKIENMVNELRKGHAITEKNLELLLADCKKVRGGHKSTTFKSKYNQYP